MKKQTKLTLALSTAAILSVGAFMTSFADVGWKEENGVWVYYVESGANVTEEWKKSGDNWYWLDSNGQMAVNKLLDIKGDYYYLDANGTMASSQWVAIPNEHADQEGQPEQHWYYFQENGKAYRRPASASNNSLYAKDIDGRQYAFDTEGRMLYGWVADGERQTDENAWQTCDYYLGTENDGVLRTSWEKVGIVADDADGAQPGNSFWDEDQDRWFYFSDGGKKVKGRENNCQKKTIDGQKYAFDEFGRMIGSWYADPSIITLKNSEKISDISGTPENEFVGSWKAGNGQGGSDYTKEFLYFGSPESGAQYSQGWFKAIPSEYLMKSKYDDGAVYWYYAEGNGELATSEIKTIDGKRYGFDNTGRRISGLVCLTMKDEDSSSQINIRRDQDNKDEPFASEEQFEEMVQNANDVNKRGDGGLFTNHKRRFYLFAGPDNSMLTGKQMFKILDTDEKIEFMFETEGRLKGSGVYGKEDNKLYLAGKLFKPLPGEKYAIIKEDFDDRGGMLSRLSVEDFIEETCGDAVYSEKRDETVWELDKDKKPNAKYYLISANGTIVKNQSKAINADGYRIAVKHSVIQRITVKE